MRVNPKWKSRRSCCLLPIAFWLQVGTIYVMMQTQTGGTLMLPLCTRTDMQSHASLTRTCLVLAQVLNDVRPSLKIQIYPTSTSRVVTVVEGLINLRQHCRGKWVRWTCGQRFISSHLLCDFIPARTTSPYTVSTLGWSWWNCCCAAPLQQSLSISKVS